MGKQRLNIFSLIVIIFLLAFPFLAKAEQTISLDQSNLNEQTCQLLQQHVPDADVNFQPGVDVDGNPVVPADLDGSNQITPPTDFHINVTRDLARYLGMNAGDPNAPQAMIGVINYDNGRLSFNGQPLGSAAQDRLIALCKPKTLD